MSYVEDDATKEILVHYLSSYLELSLIQRTLKRLFNRLDGEVHPEAIFHSDQGFHYTHPEIRSMIAKAGFKQSMSRKGNCWNTASMETFLPYKSSEFVSTNT
ncbi:DDE-type integrase/transposase/recombinase [Paenibacillus sp. FSL M7-1414]|uniref:DDE-type integrase/transposase/recombinase n=1 Tax=Paenibacillus TaxID=44249 RepID=UPI0020A1C00D|nr:DDE-type integrase/transposase/recombinase [Paenibacillus xylanexedens]